MIKNRQQIHATTVPSARLVYPFRTQGRTHLNFSVGRRVLVALEQASLPLRRQVERLGVVRRRPDP